jgi:hypothetical protein
MYLDIKILYSKADVKCGARSDATFGSGVWLKHYSQE